MGQRLDLARELDARAREAATFAEAQALRARADRLRGHRGAASFGWSVNAFFRN